MPDRLPATLRLYRQLAAVATPMLPILLSRRLRRGKEHPARIAERRGETEGQRPQGPLVWVHVASVGEMAAIVPLSERIRSRGLNMLVTSGTVTSAQLAERSLPNGVIHQFVPLDAPRYVARFLDRWRPDLALFAESDLWPNLVLASAERGIPLILINGRLSDRSYARWRRAPASIAALLGRFDLCLAQSAADSTRYAELGARRVSATGNLKVDVPPPPADDEKLAAIRAAVEGRAVIAAASTHAGEEPALIEAHRRLRHSFPDLLTVIVPRHPERGRQIVEIASRNGLASLVRSCGRLPDRDTDIYVADTMGELGMIYRLASIVFMGGSLVRHGGQNPIEPAKLGAAILHGPHVWNFAEIYAELDRAQGAVPVVDAGKLASRIDAWLTDGAARNTAARAAAETIEKLGGALERTLAAIEPYLMQLQPERR